MNKFGDLDFTRRPEINGAHSEKESLRLQLVKADRLNQNQRDCLFMTKRLLDAGNIGLALETVTAFIDKHHAAHWNLED